jgi:hypothetical protein
MTEHVAIGTFRTCRDDLAMSDPGGRTDFADKTTDFRV